MLKNPKLLSLSLALFACNSLAEQPAPEKVNWQDKGWQLIWQDEFNGYRVDETKWSYEINCWGGGNDEQQCYVDKPGNFEFIDGIMHILARKEAHTGASETEDSPAWDPTQTRTLPFTSGRLRSKNKGDWRYGRFEMRARLPHGQGTWPAFWMLPTDNVYGGWAASGEIDIMEAVNIGVHTDKSGTLSPEAETRVHGTLHYGRTWPENVYSGTWYELPGKLSPATGFHTYAVEWEEGEIRWYMDDVHYATQRSSGWFSELKSDSGEVKSNPGHAPFDQRFHLILNLAVGGAWASNVNEKGIDQQIFPQRFSIDYVRAYQCSKDPETGKGCASVSQHAKVVTGKDSH